MTSILKLLVLTGISAGLMTGCGVEKPMPTVLDTQSPQTPQTPDTPIPPVTISAKIKCEDLEISIVSADWTKNVEKQPTHKLSVEARDGVITFNELGIDRSPDFLFKLMPETPNDFVIIKGASRVLSYDCQNGNLQELDLSKSDDFEAADAQSGLVRSVVNDKGVTLIVDIVDDKVQSFTVNSDRLFTR